ncbi:MAG: hypothetical protein KIS81_00300 [Maricaulaceae bacterium]|nr:hypothetical protein [Maricaulaceae bacterium]
MVFFLSKDETEQSLRQRGFDCGEEIWSGRVENLVGEKIEYIEKYSSGFVCAKVAIEHLDIFSSAILVVTRMGAFPSVENRHLLSVLREHYHERRPNYIAPGHLFFSHQVSDVISFCELVVNYRNSAILINEASCPWVAFSSDGYMMLETPNRKTN